MTDIQNREGAERSAQLARLSIACARVSIEPYREMAGMNTRDLLIQAKDEVIALRRFFGLESPYGLILRDVVSSICAAYSFIASDMDLMAIEHLERAALDFSAMNGVFAS